MATITMYNNINVDDAFSPVFAALATGGTRCQTQTDPTGTWVDRTLPSSSNWNSICYGNSMTVAVAATTVAASSPDGGVTWTARTLPESYTWVAVAYGYDRFITISSNSPNTCYSLNGVAWYKGGYLPVSTTWSSIAYGAEVNDPSVYPDNPSDNPSDYWDMGIFVAVASGASSTTGAYSIDGGRSWNPSTLPAGDWRSVCYGDGRFVAVAYNSSAVAVSYDGRTWTSASMASSSNWISVCYGNGKFVAVAYNTTKAATSTNGIAWTDRVLPGSASNWNAVCYGISSSQGLSIYMAVCYGATTGAYSYDGITWAARALANSANYVSICFSPVTWASGDTLAITNNAIVTVNTHQTKFWKAVTGTYGKIRIENTSTSSAIGFYMGRVSAATANPITPTGLFGIEIEGDWIELGEGTGLAGQTFTLPSQYTEYVPCIEVETDPSSDVWEIWNNITGAIGPYMKIFGEDGLECAGNGKRGNYFVQSAASNPIAIVTLASGVTTANSRWVTCTSTAGVFPGAHITGTNIPNNTVVQKVLSDGITLELNVICTVAGSSITFTCYNPVTSQFTNTITVGDGINGNTVPNGARVRIANIIFSDLTPADVMTASNLVNGNITIALASPISAINCMFGHSYVSMAQAASVYFRHVGFAYKFAMSECYSVDIDYLGTAATPTYWYYSAKWIIRDQRYSVSNPAGYTAPTGTCATAFSYISDAVIKNWHDVVYSSGHFTGTGALNQIDVQYSDDMVWENIRIVQLNLMRANFGLTVSVRCYRNSFTNLEIYGCNPLSLGTSDDNTFTNVEYCLNMTDPVKSFASLMRVYADPNASALDQDPSTDNPSDTHTNWEYLRDETPYYVKTRTYYSWMDRSEKSYYDSNEYPCVPFQGGWQFPDFVSIKPTETYAHAVTLDWVRRAPEPALIYFEIYRGTTPGFTERSLANKVYGNSATTVTCTQGIKIASTSTAARIFTFASATKKITASGTPGSFLTDGFAVDDTVFVNGSYYGNDGTYTITVLTATEMTVAESLIDEVCSLAPAVSISRATSKSLSTRAFTFAADNSITVPAGQAWTTADGFAIGDVVDVSGSRTQHNNGVFTISALTATKMTFLEKMVAEVTPTSTSAVTTRIFTFATAGDTLTATGTVPGSFITDGHVVGDTVYCTSATNPGPYTIIDLTATVMTFSENVTDETCAAGTIVYRRAIVTLRKPTAGTRYYYRLRKYNFNSISTLNCCSPGYFYTTTRATTGTNLATITTSVGHGFIVGQVVSVAGLVDPMTSGANLYIGTKTITVTAALTTFAYAIVHGNESTADTLGKISPATLMSTFRECTDNIATITTNYPHLLVVNQTVNIAAMTDSTYDGTFKVASVPSTTTFTYALTHGDEGSTADTAGVISNRTLFSASCVVSRTVAAAPVSTSSVGKTMTFTASLKKIVLGSGSWLSDGFLALDTITISGSLLGNDGTYTISSVTATDLIVLETLPSDELGDDSPVITVTGRAIATLTVPIAHGYVFGQTITVFGMNDATYNGTYTVRSLPSTTTVSFSITHGTEASTADNSGKITTPRWDFDNIYYLVGFKFASGSTYVTNVVNSIYASMFAPGIEIKGQGIPTGTTVVSVDPSGREMIISNPTTTSTDTILATTISVARVRVDTNVVTIVTSSPHNFIVGYKIYVNSMADTTYNGTYTITQVPSSTRFSYALTHADAAEAPVTAGTVRAADVALYIPVQPGMAATLVTTIPSGTEVVSVENSYMITLSQTPVIAVQYVNVTFQTFTESPELNCVPNLYKKALNFATYSKDFTNAAWVKSNITPTGNTYQAPFDSSWAATAGLDQLAATAGGGTATLTVANLKASTQYTASFWVRADQTAALPNGVAGSFAFGTTTTNFTATNELKQYAATYTTGVGETSKNIVITITTNGQVIHCGDVMVNMGATPTACITTAAAVAVELYPPALPITKLASYGRNFASNGTNLHQGVQLTLGTAPTGSYYSEIHVSSVPDFTPSSSTLYGTTFSIATYHFSVSGSSRNVWDGITKLSGGGAAGTSPLYFAVSSLDNRILNADIDMEYTNTIATAMINLATASHDNLFHNLYFGKVKNYEVGTSIIYTQWANSIIGNRVQNIRCDNYDIAMSNQSLNSVVKGITGCRAFPATTATSYVVGSTSDGIAAAYGSTYGTMFYESYIGETEGVLTLIPEDTLGDDKPYTVLSGTTHSFNNQGVMYIPNAGSSFEFTWPNKIYGVSGFTKRKPKLLGYDHGGTPATVFDLQEALKVEMAINTGSGYVNPLDPSDTDEYFRATPENLSALSVSATNGFYLKIRITSRNFMRHGAQTNLYVVGETIRGLLSGATAVVDEVYDYGATGCIILSNISGSFIPAESIVNHTTSQVRSPNVATNGFAIGPSFTSYFNALQIFTNVDQTILYPSSTAAVTLTGLISGSEVRAYLGTDPATAEEIGGIESSSTSFSFSQSYDGQNGYIVIHALTYQSWRLEITYGAEDISIPVQQIRDRQYLNPA